MRKVAVLLFSFIILGLAGPSRADPLVAPWAWPVAVVPPPEGWQTERGEAIRAGLLLLQGRLNEPAEGVRGFDVVFSWDEPLLPGAVDERVEAWRREGRVAVLSFASAETDRALALALGREGPPFLAAGGEDLPLRDPEGEVPPYLFALRQEKAFRANALSDYVRRLGQREAGVFSDLLDRDLLRLHDAARVRLERGGLNVLSFLFRTSADDILLARVDEVIAAGAQSGFLFLDGLAALDVWALVQRQGYDLDLYYGGSFGSPLGAARGLTVVGQDHPLKTDPQLELLRDALWLEEGLRVRDLAAAARAYSLGDWLARGLEAAGPEAAPLALALAEVEGLPYGSRLLDIDPKTHRPARWEVALLEVTPGGRLVEKARVEVASSEVAEGVLPFPEVDGGL